MIPVLHQFKRDAVDRKGCKPAWFGFFLDTAASVKGLAFGDAERRLAVKAAGG